MSEQRFVLRLEGVDAHGRAMTEDIDLPNLSAGNEERREAMNDVSEKACRDAAEQKRQILRAHFPWAEVGVATPESGHPDGAYRVRVESNGRVAYTFWNGWSPPDDIVAALHVFLERPAGPVSICDLHLWLPVFVGDASFPIESIDRSCADPVVGLRLPDGLREVRLSTIERCPNGNLAVKP